MSGNKKAKLGFKKPSEIPLDEKMVPVSARIPESVSKRLNQEAKDAGHTTAKLISHAVCEYIKFLDENG